MIGSGAVTLRALHIFVAVFDTQNFSVVARREDMSPSTVSRIIHQLEDAIGQQLFYRNTRAVIPTETGRVFVESARKMVVQMQEAERALQARVEEPSGVIRINAPVFFGQHHIAPWLGGLAQRYPRLSVELTLNDDLIDPHRDATDLLFRIGTLTDSSFHARVFGPQRYFLAASPAYIRHHPALCEPESLAAHDCLVYKGHAGPNRWLFRKPGQPWVHYPVTPRLASNDALTLLTAAATGMGVVLFPDWLLGDSIKKGALVPLATGYEVAIQTEQQHVAAIYPHSRYAPFAVRAVIDYFVDVFGQPLYWQP